MKKANITFGAIVIACVFLLASCDGIGELFTPSSVTYTITGTALTVDVTMASMSGGTIQYSNVSVPVSYDMGTAPSGTFLYVSAQNNGATGDVTTAIYVNGSLRTSDTSSGAYVISTSSGSL